METKEITSAVVKENSGTMDTRKIMYSVSVVKWFDRVNGNTYHS